MTTLLSDGSAVFYGSFPLPKGHWLYKKKENKPPMRFRLGTDHPEHDAWERSIREAARFAVRSATMNGTDNDFDPDAMVQMFIIGMIGYYTPDGRSSEDI